MGDGEVFALHAACTVGYGIQPVLAQVYRDATDAPCQSLAKTTIADVLRDTVARYEAALS